LIIGFSRGISRDEKLRLLSERGLAVKSWHLSGDFATVLVPAGAEDETAAALVKEPGIESAERPVLLFPQTHMEDSLPNDPRFSQYQSWNFDMIQVQQAWHFTRGSGATVAVVDTGVAYEDRMDPLRSRVYARSPEFEGTAFDWPRNTFAKTDFPSDDWGHGTHVTGTIAQATNNGFEGSGIAHEATIIPIKVCGPDPVPGLSYGCLPQAIADGIDWAVTAGAQVINLSLGSAVAPGALVEAAVERALSGGIVVVAAGGNNFSSGGTSTLNYPAAYPGVVAVGAVQRDGTRAAYSNYGFGEDGQTLGVVAPGGGGVFAEPSSIYQYTYEQYCAGAGAGQLTVFTEFATCGANGTSMAAAHVTAVAALIRSAYPQLAGREVASLLQCSAKDLGSSGFDIEYGHGLVQAADALRDLDQNGRPDCLEPPINWCRLRGVFTPAGIVLDEGAAAPQGMPSPLPFDTPTPTPTPEPTPEPAPTATPGEPAPLEPTPTPTATPGPGDTPTPTPSPTPSPSPRATLEPSQPEPPGACGDVNCDHAVDAVDALLILRMVAAIGLSPACSGNAFTDCDNELTAIDALIVWRYVAGLSLRAGPTCPKIGYD
jgi:serine protease